MEIQILNSQDSNGFSPIIGARTIELLDRFAKKLDIDELSTTKDETVDILSYCIGTMNDRIIPIPEVAA